MFFLATADEHGHAAMLVQGRRPGFVRVVDEHTLAFPSYDGNGMYLSLGNILGKPQVGMLFVDFTSPKRLRVNGIASIDEDDPLLAEFAEAQLDRASARDDVLPNCSRYIHKMELVERSRFVPHDDHETPIPDWKRREWARDVLPAGDPANDDESAST